MDKLKELLPLNFNLMANPVNWVTIALMIAIAGVGIVIIFPQLTDAIED